MIENSSLTIEGMGYRSYAMNVFRHFKLNAAPMSSVDIRCNKNILLLIFVLLELLSYEMKFEKMYRRGSYLD